MTKKIILSLLTVMVTISINAQVIKVYDIKKSTTSPIAKYTNSENSKYKIVFSNKKSPTGRANAKINGQTVSVGWVQLWKGGPKFAEYNVGATTQTEIGTLMSSEDAIKTGSQFVWGANWKTPSEDALKLLFDENKTSVSLCYMNGIKGYKFTGIEDGYKDYYIFLPAGAGSIGEYWTSSYDGTYITLLSITEVSGISDYVSFEEFYGELNSDPDANIRPILSE